MCYRYKYRIQKNITIVKYFLLNKCLFNKAIIEKCEIHDKKIIWKKPTNKKV